MIKNEDADQPTNTGDEVINDPGEDDCEKLSIKIKVLFLNFGILSSVIPISLC